MSDKQTLTTPQVAKMCDVDQRTVWNWCRAGKGPRHTKTVGGHSRFEPAAVAQWMAEREMTVPAELRQFLTPEYQTKEELLAAVVNMEHTDRVALLAEWKRWLAVRA